ncbi:MAG: saccharopine dehydrogenase family protein [Candidatus Methanodesulfokora sp.]
MSMKVLLLGAGISSSSAALDLADDRLSPDVKEIAVADISIERAEKVVRKALRLTKRKKVEALCVDASSDDLINLIKNYDVVINGLLYTYIPKVMKSCLEAGVNYLDLGSDVETVRMQKSLDKKFKDRGITAIIGMGCSPGMINIMAKRAAEELDYVEKITMREGWIDLTDYGSAKIPLPVPYSFDTIADEFEDKVEIWTDKGLILVEALSGAEIVEFPEPIGRQKVYYVEHPEIYTIGEYLRGKGLKFVDYKLSFPDELVMKYSMLRDIGLLNEEEIFYKGKKMTIRDLVREKALEKIETIDVTPDDFDAIIVSAYGLKNERPATCRVISVVRSNKKWRVSAQSLAVGVPASIAAQMVGYGKIDKGVYNPEEVIDSDYFIKSASKRGIEFRISLETKLDS